MPTWDDFSNQHRYGMAREGLLVSEPELNKIKPDYLAEAKKFKDPMDMDRLHEYIALFKDDRKKPSIKKYSDDSYAVEYTDKLTVFIDKNIKTAQSAVKGEMLIGAPAPGDPKKRRVSEVGDFVTSLPDMVRFITALQELQGKVIPSDFRIPEWPISSQEIDQFQDAVSELPTVEFLNQQFQKLMLDLESKTLQINNSESFLVQLSAQIDQKQSELSALINNIQVPLSTATLPEKIQDFFTQVTAIQEQLKTTKDVNIQLSSALVGLINGERKLEEALLDVLRRDPTLDQSRIAQMTALGQDLQALKSRQEKLQNERDSLETEVNSLKLERRTLTNSIDLSKQVYETISESVASMNTKIGKLTATEAKLREDVEAKKKEYQQLNEDESNLRQSIQTLKQSRVQMEKEQKKLASDLRKAQRDLTDEQSALNKAKEELASAIEKRSKASEAEGFAAQRLQAITQQIDAGEKKAQSLAETYDNSVAQFEAKLREMEQKRVQIRQVDTELYLLQTEKGYLVKLAQNETELTNNVRSLTQETATLQSGVELLKNQYESSDKELKRLQGEVLGLDGETKTKQARLNDIDKRIQTNSKTLLELRENKVKEEENLKQVLTRIQEQEESLRKKQEQYKTAQGDSAVLDKFIAFREEQLKKVEKILEEKLTGTSKDELADDRIRELERVTAELKETTAKLKLYKDDLKVTETQLAEDTASVALMQSLIATLKEEEQRLRVDNEEYLKRQQTIQNTINSLETLRSSLLGDVNDLNKEKAEKADELAKLAQQTNAEQAKLTALQLELAKATADKTAAEASLKTLRDKNADLQTRINAKNLQIRQKQGLIDQLNRSVQELQDLEQQEQERLNQTRLELERELDTLQGVKDRLAQAIQDVQAADQKVNQLDAEIAAKTVIRDNLTNDVNDLIKDIEHQERELNVQRSEEGYFRRKNAELSKAANLKEDILKKLEANTIAVTKDFKRVVEEYKQAVDEKKVKPGKLSPEVVEILKPKLEDVGKAGHYRISLMLDGNTKTPFYNIQFPEKDVTLVQLLMFFAINTPHQNEETRTSMIIEDTYSNLSVNFYPLNQELSDIKEAVIVKDWWYFLPMDYDDCERGIKIIQ